MAHQVGALGSADLEALREQVDYLALGHIHKPYQIDNWIFNPGSLETCNIEEAHWGSRGYFVVESTSDGIWVQPVLPARRPAYRLDLEVDTMRNPQTLYNAICVLLKNTNIPTTPSPIVELTLIGVLPFGRFALDIDHIKSLIDQACSPAFSR